MSAVPFGKSAEQSPITIVCDFLNSLDSELLNVSTSHNVGGDFSKFKLSGSFAHWSNPMLKTVEIYVAQNGFIEANGIGDDQKRVSTMTFGGDGASALTSFFSNFLVMVCYSPSDTSMADKIVKNTVGQQIETLCGLADKPDILPSEQHAQWQQSRNNRDGVTPDGQRIPHLG